MQGVMQGIAILGRAVTTGLRMQGVMQGVLQGVRLGGRLERAPSRAPSSKRKGTGLVWKLDGLGVRGVGGAEGAGIRCTRNTPAVRSIAAGGARDGARDRVCAL